MKETIWKSKSILLDAIKKLEMSKVKLEKAQEDVVVANKACGEAFRVEREASGLGLRELARKIGISPAYLSDIEKGRRNFPKNIKVKV